MPIYVKDPADSAWKQGNNPTSKLLYFRWNSTWYSVANAWLRQAGAWTPTDYVGVPNAPTNLVVTSAVNNYTTIGLAWTAPTGGAPVDHYRFIFYKQDGSFWADYNLTGTTLNWNVGPDTYYQMEVVAVSAAGVESPPSNRVRYLTGHPQQTRQDPVYGWGTPFDADTNAVYASTTAVVSGGATYPGSYACDWPDGSWPNTFWAGGARSSTTYFDALRVSVASAYRRVYSVRVWPKSNHRIWLGMAQDGAWYGGQNYPTNANFWFDATARAYFASHNYLMVTPEWPAGTEYEFVLDNAYTFTADRCVIDVAVDSLKSLLGGTRAALTEIIVRLQDWTVVSYNTVVTVTQKNNSYW